MYLQHNLYKLNFSQNSYKNYNSWNSWNLNYLAQHKCFMKRAHRRTFLDGLWFEEDDHGIHAPQEN